MSITISSSYARRPADRSQVPIRSYSALGEAERAVDLLEERCFPREHVTLAARGLRRCEQRCEPPSRLRGTSASLSIGDIRRTFTARSLIAVALTAVLFAVAGCGADDEGQAGAADTQPMPTSSDQQAQFPPMKGLYEGEQVLFVHSEASTRELANALTNMMNMNSPVPLVPTLAEVPRAALANVYAFENGVEGNGPFGFQPDVFGSVPGDPDYSPLRAVNVVRWNSDATPRVLRSATDIREAKNNGEITIERTDAVINMPMLTWPGGKR